MDINPSTLDSLFQDFNPPQDSSEASQDSSEASQDSSSVDEPDPQEEDKSERREAPTEPSFSNSERREAPADCDFPEPRDLWNRLPPNVEIKHERVRHRLLAYLIGSGCTQGEAAQELGYTDAWVSQVVRQDWFQQLVLEEITRTGRDSVEELIRNAAPGSVLKVIELRDTAESEVVQLNASRELLNRYLGAAPITVRHEKVGSSNPVEEVERLEREAERLRGTNERAPSTAD